ncbi:MAG: hypothetical protein IKL55_01905 [Clostridia bacterium]|nr:hypothetical protein [Clostridia bacterium]
MGFARIFKKIAKCDLRSESINGSTYYFDNDNRIVARLYESNLLSLFVTNQEGRTQALNLVLNFKYKCDQGVVIADIAFVSDLSNNQLPHVSKNRYLTLKDNTVLDEYETASAGTVDVSDDVLSVSIPFLGVEDRCEKVVKGIEFSEAIFNLTTRTVR